MLKASRPQRAPVLLWRAGAWEQTADALSPETRVRVRWPGGEDELWACSAGTEKGRNSSSFAPCSVSGPIPGPVSG